MTSSNTNIFNEAADFLFSRIGANPVPADTKYKKINIRWGEFQDKSVPIEVHESRKEKGEYDKGIAVMTGRLHRGKNEGKYLIGIDCDNKKAIDEICNSLGLKDINKLAGWTWVEQHKDNVDKAHIYILSSKSLKNKGRDPKKVEAESLNEIPAIEVKCERQTMFTAPSIHEDGYPYEILGTREPVLCDEFELHLDKISRKYTIEYLHNSTEQNNNNNNSTLSEPLRQLILLLEVPSDFKFRISKGARHRTMISFANKLLFKYKFDNNNNNGNKLKDFFNEVNDKLCIPPLPENEVETIWRDAVKFSEKKIAEMRIINYDEDDTLNYKTTILLPLQIGDKLLEQEIVQNFVYDIQTNSIDCTLNTKYDLTKIIVPINIKQWPDVRKTFRKLCEEKCIKENDISLLLESIDNNFDLIKKYYMKKSYEVYCSNSSSGRTKEAKA
jgi:bifunctional DNA primase/polymerase-like protein